MDIQTKLIRIDRERSAPGSFIDAEFVMHIVFSGSFVFQHREEVHSVRGHDLILIPPNTLHALGDLSEIDMMVIHFYDRSHYLLTQDFPRVVSLSMDELEPVLALVSLLKKYWESKDQFLRMACDGIVQAILSLYLHYGRTKGKRGEGRDTFKNWEAIKAAVEIVDAEYADVEIGVEDLAARIGLSFNYFCSLFHRYTNVTPLAYLMKVRIDNAKRRLFSDRMNVSETAVECGFRSIQSFSKTFKRIEGVSPTEWLKGQRD